MGRGVGLHDPDFITYRRQLVARGKPPLVALIAVGHRAHRLAFAMLRSQRPFDSDRWERAVAGHHRSVDEQVPVMATPPVAAHQHDVTCPPHTPSPTRRHQATNNQQPSPVSGAVAGARNNVDVSMRHDLDL